MKDLLLFAGILAILIIAIITMPKHEEGELKPEYKPVEYDTELLKLEVCDCIQSLPLQNKEVVFLQAKLETGTFRSRLFVEQNNAFGMKCPRSRPTTSIGCNNGYATYQNVYYSVVDYWIWQRLYAHNLNEKEYLSKLTKLGYAEDVNYINKIKHLSK